MSDRLTPDNTTIEESGGETYEDLVNLSSWCGTDERIAHPTECPWRIRPKSGILVARACFAGPTFGLW